MKLRNKKAAMEMSVGTIVTIVLLMSVLIFGLVFVRNIMCSGIKITDDVTSSVQKEVGDLFGAGSYGVKCIGEDNSIPKVGVTGDSIKLGCIAVVDSQTEYTIQNVQIKSIPNGKYDVNKWITDKDTRAQKAIPGNKNIINVVMIKPSKNIDATTVKVEFDVKDGVGTTQSHTIVVDLVPVGAFSSAIC